MSVFIVRPQAVASMRARIAGDRRGVLGGHALRVRARELVARAHMIERECVEENYPLWIRWQICQHAVRARRKAARLMALAAQLGGPVEKYARCGIGRARRGGCYRAQDRADYAQVGIVAGLEAAVTPEGLLDRRWPMIAAARAAGRLAVQEARHGATGSDLPTVAAPANGLDQALDIREQLGQLPIAQREAVEIWLAHSGRPGAEWTVARRNAFIRAKETLRTKLF